MNQAASLVTPADLLNIQRPLLINEQKQGNLLHNQKERVADISEDEQLVKLCTDAGFIKTVAPGQYFSTDDAEEFTHFGGHVACRARHEESSKP